MARTMSEVIEDTVLPARASWSRRMGRGARLRIVDLEGKQAVDFLCYNAHDYADRYAAADTMKINPAGIFLSTGSVLYSVGLTPLFTIVADSCGRHDTIGGGCSAALNRFRYNVGYQPNCRDNFLRELARSAWERKTWWRTSISSCTCRSVRTARWTWDRAFRKRAIMSSCARSPTCSRRSPTARRSTIRSTITTRRRSASWCRALDKA